MITRNNANSLIKRAIKGVVPQPGATFPYSEFRGFSKVPKLVTRPLDTLSCLFGLNPLEVAIRKKL
jgi:hypothetical protein